MTPDGWLEAYYCGEFFSGDLNKLKIAQDHFNLFFKNKKIITIAGTNGKGETSRYFNKLLEYEGVSSALWTSPHLLKVNERFNFNTQEVSDLELINVFEKVKKEIEKIGLELSYFEFLFICFLFLAQEKDIDYLILEVGLGGRLDAVNILDASLVLLSSISRDHIELLGGRYDLILKEKLGVLRPGIKFISSLELNYLRQKTKAYIEQKSIDWIDLFDSKTLSKSDDFSKRNRILALNAFKLLFMKQSLLDLGGEFLCRRGEFERSGALFSLFPSHNVDGVRKLVHFLKQVKYTNYDKLLISFSEREFKEVSVMMEQFLELFDNTDISLFMFEHFKAINKKKLKKLSERYKIKIYFNQSYFEGVQPEQKILVTGSNYFLGHFLKLT